ncbi:hypothetical protein D3C76_1318620 [compost metagenome]
MFQGREDLQPCPVQQHADIGERDIEKITDLFQLQSLAFAQHQDAALQLGQAEQSMFKALAQLILAEQGFGRVFMPGRRR